MSRAKFPLMRIRMENEIASTKLLVEYNGLTWEAPLAFRLRDVKRLSEAYHCLAASQSTGALPLSSLESLEWRIEQAKELIESGDEDYAYLDRLIAKTLNLTKKLASSPDPFASSRGVMERRGYRSPVDGRLREYVLYVPPGWREDGETSFGLVVTLHGLNSSPMKAMQAVFGLPLDEGETKEMRERHPKRPIRGVSYFVLAPSGFGNSGYRAYGERDVLDALDAVRRRYRIDENRIYLTGASMGGIGAAAIPFHNPDIFAAAAPLCGYHSIFKYSDLKGVRLKSWERFLAEVRSNAEWAANGEYLPLYVVHGQKDTPRHSKVLIDAYRRLNYSCEYLTPDAGHNVWDETYQDGKIFTYFSQFKRVEHPRQITLDSSRLRHGKSYWVTINDATNYVQWSRVHAYWNEDNKIRVETKNVDALTLKNDPELRTGDQVSLVIDGQEMALDSAAQSWPFYRVHEGVWVNGTPPPCSALQKRPGLAGPLRDAHYEPLLFVYGTLLPGEAVLSRRVIGSLRKPRAGVTVEWPVKADREVTAEDIANHSLVLVGTPEGNSLLKRVLPQLPLALGEGRLDLGKQQWKGPNIAVAMIYPNPLNPNRYVVIHSGTGPQAIFYAAHLPDLVPDYVVYDATGWARKGGLVLNERDVLAAGFFDKHWKL